MPGVEIENGQDRVRFATLLATLVVLLAVAPLVDEFVRGLPALRISFSGVFLAGVYAVSGKPRVLRIGLAIAVPAFLTTWLEHAQPSTGTAVANLVLGAAFLAFVAVVILRAVLEQLQVSSDTIYGGICVYLLLGLLWQTGFSLVELLQPGSFLLGGVPLSEVHAGASGPQHFPELMYFSYVTITTLGYGDIVPANSVARAMAVSESVVGQLFVAIFIARLVGLHLAHSRPASDA